MATSVGWTRHRASSSDRLLASLTTVLFTTVITVVAQLNAAEAATEFQPKPEDFNIGAFNVQKLGRTKSSNTEIMKQIAQVITKFDIIALVEILNVDAVEKLLGYVNECQCSGMGKCNYKYVISAPLYEKHPDSAGVFKKQLLGNNNYAEHYAFFYREDAVEVLSTHQYKPQEVQFMRPPFAVHIQTRLDKRKFLYIVVHTSPKHATKELTHLKDAYEDFAKKTGTYDAIIGGDLNAGCDYWSERKLQTSTGLTSDFNFIWLIDSKARTNTVGIKPCPYDRFIANGLKDVILSESAGPYIYYPQRHWVRAVSDHYPIGVRLRLYRPPERSLPICPSPKIQKNRRDEDPPYKPPRSFFLTKTKVGERQTSKRQRPQDLEDSK